MLTKCISCAWVQHDPKKDGTFLCWKTGEQIKLNQERWCEHVALAHHKIILHRKEFCHVA